MRIHLTGAAGTGTTTLGKALARFHRISALDTEFSAGSRPSHRLLRDLGITPP